MCHDARALGPLPGDAEHAVSDVDKFLFDTNGFVVVKDVFSKDDLRAFHDAIDAHAHLIHERKGQLGSPPPRPRSRATARPAARTSRASWAGKSPTAIPSRSVLAHPRTVPYLHELVGPGYRLDHNPLLIMQDPGAEGFEFHGGSTLDSGDWNHPLGYDFRHGKMRCNLLAFAVSTRRRGGRPAASASSAGEGSHKRATSARRPSSGTRRRRSTRTSPR